MATQIQFNSVFIRTAGFALDDGTKRVRINVTASLTKEVRDKMNWHEVEKPRNFEGRTVDEAADKIKLDGELHGRTMTLTPNEGELKKLAFSVDIAEVKSFELATVQEEASKRRELRFQIMSSAPGILAEVETYCDAIGQGKGTLKISYVEQGKLDLDPNVTASAEQRKAASEIPVQ